MGQADSARRPPARRITVICASLILASAIIGVLPQSGFAWALSSSGFQETRPRRVSPPQVDGTARANPGAPADPPPAKKKLSAARTGVIPSPGSTAPAHAFTVQLGAFLNRDNARKLAGLLESKGYNPDVSTKTDAHKRIWHLVRVGSHPDRAHAAAAAAEIERKLKMKTIVRPANSL